PQPAFSAVGGADYLEAGAGARWAGMGGAARAAARDTTAGYWNPAGLAAQGPSEWQFGSMLAMAPMGRRLSWLSASLQTDRLGAWGAGWMHNSVDGLETVDSAGTVGPDGASTEDAVFLSHGGSLLYQLKWGLTAKMLSQRYGVTIPVENVRATFYYVNREKSHEPTNLPTEEEFVEMMKR
ncbi:MAG: hypothetical protein AAB368_13905, partial [bacterium]